jgi:hypothetical protein
MNGNLLHKSYAKMVTRRMSECGILAVTLLGREPTGLVFIWKAHNVLVFIPVSIPLFASIKRASLPCKFVT